MDPPRDSSDIRIALACNACNGNGGFGSRSVKLTPDRPDFLECDTCNGTGWTLKSVKELTAMERARLVAKLSKVP